MKSKIQMLVKSVMVISLLTLLFSCGVKVQDADGNKYDVVKIGDQYWTRQNLRTTSYNDGTKIKYIVELPADKCHDNTTGYYANMDSNSKHLKDSLKYGKFYNWHAVNTGKLAPKGWHVATKEDWEILEQTIGKDSSANKLRTTYHWLDSNSTSGQGTDEFYFSALPTGYKNYDDGYWKDSDGDQKTVFWTSTIDKNHITDGIVYPYSIVLGIAFPGIVSFDNYHCPNFECSVRCVKDSPKK